MKTDKLLGLSLIVIVCLFVSMLVGSFNHKARILELETTITNLNIVLDRRAATIKACVGKIDEYEMHITKFMMNTWEPGMSIHHDFEEEWYGHPIWTAEATRRGPESIGIDIGEILDRKIQGE
jgi:hypothetical protein